MNQLIKRSQFFQVKGIRDSIMSQYNKYNFVNKKGYFLLQDPVLNKTLEYSLYERRCLNLEGFIPMKKFTIEEQSQIILKEFHTGIMQQAEIHKDEETNQIGVTPDMIRKARVLRNLQDLDNTLYYHMIIKNWEETLRIIHTPTVAWLCKNYSSLYRRCRGMIVSLTDKGDVATLIKNCPLQTTHIFFIVDGSKIMSIGDWGIGAMEIAVARKDIYVAAAGYNPWKTCPVVIDTGTDNEKLLNDDNYIGLRQKRCSNEIYFELLDEFLSASSYRYPNAIYVFEDIDPSKSFKILERYSEKYKIISEDLQGTGSVVLGGILGGLRIQNLSPQMIRNLKIFCVGAGNAATGVISTLFYYLKTFGMSQEQIYKNISVFDINGLQTANNCTNPLLKKYLIPKSKNEGKELKEMLKTEKPNVIIGTTGQRGIFDEEILTNLSKDNNFRPLIFALSNPTSKSECTANQVYKYTNGRGIFISGSPFPDIKNEENLIIKSNCAYNAFIMPGFARGLTIGKVKIITDELRLVATIALSENLNDNYQEKNRIYPSINNLCEISDYIAAKVLIKAYELNLCQGKRVKEFLSSDREIEEVISFVKRRRWEAQYQNMISYDNQFKIQQCSITVYNLKIFLQKKIIQENQLILHQLFVIFM